LSGCEGHPLLPVSRGCRDIVLSSISSITLDTSMRELATVCDPAPWAWLLYRACCQATPGLAVKLCLESRHNGLHLLLQPGIDCGWSKVHSLEVGTAT
jgi:hypothetical protein